MIPPISSDATRISCRRRGGETHFLLHLKLVGQGHREICAAGTTYEGLSSGREIGLDGSPRYRKTLHNQRDGWPDKQWILAALVHPLLVLSRLERYLGPLTIFYPSLIAMFAMIVWIIFFNRV